MKLQNTAQAIVPSALLAAAIVATSVPLPTPPTTEDVGAHHAVALATDVLTLEGTRHPFWYSTPVQDALQGDVCSGEFVCQAVDYPASRSIFSKPRGVEALDEKLQAATDPVVVVGYDQGASVAVALMVARHYGELPYSNVQESYVLIGNPHRNHDGHGGISKIRKAFENPYQTLEVFREYDGYADFPDNPFNLLALANAFAGMSILHRHYEDVDVDSVDNLVYIDGDTTHLLVPTEHLPLLQVWYDLGLGFAVEWAEPTLKKIIDSAYDRSMYLTQTPPEDDQLQEADSLTAQSSMTLEETAAIHEELHEETQEAIVSEQSVNDTSGRHAASPDVDHPLQPSAQDSGAETLADDEQETGQSPSDDSANKLELEQYAADPGDGNDERESQRRMPEPQAEPSDSREAKDTSGDEAPSADETST